MPPRVPTIAQFPCRVSPCRIAEDPDVVASAEAPTRGRLAERTRPTDVVGTSVQSTRDYEVFRGELDRPRVIRPDAAAGPRARIEPGSNLGRKHGPVLLRWAAGPSVPETRRATGRLGRAAWADSGHALSFAVLTSGDPIRNPETTLLAGSLDGSHRQTPRVAATDLAF